MELEGAERSEASETLEAWERLLREVTARGFGVLESFATRGEVAALRDEALRERGGFRAAGIGKARAVAQDVRGDVIRWLAEEPGSAAEGVVRERLERLRVRLNRRLFLGLRDYEAHFAIYPAGGFYRKHLDRFQVDGARTVSFVLYLNEGWGAGDGGELRIFEPEEPEREAARIVPEGGRLAVFLSESVWHEVLPAKRERVSLTGWFRR